MSFSLQWRNQCIDLIFTTKTTSTEVWLFSELCLERKFQNYVDLFNDNIFTPSGNIVRVLNYPDSSGHSVMPINDLF
jgi:hypothetical protein